MQNDELKFGVIGMSEGNGHPYSWSAIMNGYDTNAMASCPFPVIPEYLVKQQLPDEKIPGVKVTHIWTQEKSVSKHIAMATKIPEIVDDYKQMLNQVDGILLARDDPENHYEMSKPFLEAGLPIYIDKPIANNIEILKKIYSHEKYEGQIFSCSALRFAKEFCLKKEDFDLLGKIFHVNAIVPKSWSKYSAHVIDPVLDMFNLYGEQCSVIGAPLEAQGRVVTVKWERGMTGTFSALGIDNAPILIEIFGENSNKRILFTDTFYAFKRALTLFIDGIREKKIITKRYELESLVDIVERGLLN